MRSAGRGRGGTASGTRAGKKGDGEQISDGRRKKAEGFTRKQSWNYKSENKSEDTVCIVESAAASSVIRISSVMFAERRQDIGNRLRRLQDQRNK